MIKAVIFDFDGTLSNRQLNAYLTYEEFLRSYFPDVPKMEFEAIMQDMLTFDMFGTSSTELRGKVFAAKYNVPDDFVDSLSKYWHKQMAVYATLRPESLNVLNALKGKYKLGLCTNGHSETQHQKVITTNIGSYFDKIIVSGDIDIHKPDVRIFKMMADGLGVKPEECVFVGDTFSSDILGAYKAGMVPVWIWTFDERPSKFDGYRITNLRSLLDILKELNNNC